MTNERVVGITEEISDCQDLKELKALWGFGQHENNEYGDAQFVPDFKAAVARLRNKEEVAMPNVGSLEAKVAELLAQVEALKSRTVNDQNKSGAKANPPVQPVVRGSKRYKLLSDDVSWSTKPQVAAIMRIIVANAKVGDVLDEEHIIAMMEANVDVLQTRQGGRRVWKYYAGNHVEGLTMHCNIVRV